MCVCFSTSEAAHSESSNEHVYSSIVTVYVTTEGWGPTGISIVSTEDFSSLHLALLFLVEIILLFNYIISLFHYFSFDI